MTQTTSNPTSDRQVCDLTARAVRKAGLWKIPGAEQEGSRTHLVSPAPFPLTAGQIEQLQKLGQALAQFYSAANELYLRSDIEWTRGYLDIGKGEEIVRHGLMNYQKRELPRVIRPDILITETGLAITELDSVPGGIGQLDCLSAAYADAGFELVGGARGMRDGFAAIIRDVSGQDDPVCAIVVSEESADYLPEMKYLAGELREEGLEAHAVPPQEIEFTEDGLFVGVHGARKRIDVVYRFFELFDLMNIPKAELVSYALKKRRTAVTPPYKHFLEEKMLLALLHSEALDGYWLNSLGEANLTMLRSVIARTYILDSRPVPPHAQIEGFEWRGGPIRDWRAIKNATQKERRLIIKPSGFSPLSWGSRGVQVGHDLSGEEWSNAVENAIAAFEHSPHVLQPFRDAQVIPVRHWDEPRGEVVEMQSRVRLCPYYFVAQEEVKLGGVLATAVPRDKKLIHGMTDAVMCPCSEERESQYD